MSVDSSCSHENGFPWLQWLAVIALVALLAGLALGRGVKHHAAAERHRSVANHARIKASLERYKEEWGQYPTPVNPDAVVRVSGRDMRVGAARMLYQVLTGDGDSEIKFPSATGNPSDGQISEEEVRHSFNLNPPKYMIATSSEGYYYLVDGWGRPFQYVKGGAEDAINPTYDLWSFGDMRSKDPLFYDAETRRKIDAVAKWIKNW